MDEFVVLDDSDSGYIRGDFNTFDNFHPVPNHSEGIWLSIAKIIWGKDYIPLDEHDRISFNMILTICMLLGMTIILGIYIIIKRRKSASKQRARVQNTLKKEKLRVNGVNHKQKKME